MALNPKQWNHTKDIATLVFYMISLGYKPRVAYAKRSKEEARRLGFENSLHTKYLATDIDLFDKDGNYLPKTESHRIFGEYWKKLRPGNSWGGDFRDHKGNRDGNHYSSEHEGVR